MRKLNFSDLAKSEIDNIWDYTEENWGTEQADRYNRLIEDACLQLADGTRAGLSAEYIRPGYQKLFVGKHTIYFRVTEGEVIVVRILHQSMDVDEQLNLSGDG